MAATVVKGSPVEAAVLTRLLELRDSNGEVSAADVRTAAAALGKSERTVWRMVKRGYVRKERQRWLPDETVADLMHRNRGCVALVRAEMVKDKCAPPVSVRTMQRTVAARYDQHQLANMRGGYQAMAATLPVQRRDITGRNQEWAIDHTILPVFVLTADGSWCKPWMTTVLDAGTRMVLSVTISPNDITLEDVVENVALAAEGFTTEDGIFVGGKPDAIMSDRGGDLVTEAMTTQLVALGIQRRFTEAYTPHQNGRIERWHGTIKREVCPRLPGYDRSDMTARDPRKAAKPLIDPRMLMPIETLQHLVLEEIAAYNFERGHSALPAGCTPYEAWVTDPTDVEKVDPAAIRAAMTQSKRVKVTRGQVRWDNRHYDLPHGAATIATPFAQTWREILANKYVIIRYLPTRPEFVEIETEQGQHVGRALWTELLTADDAAKTLGHRKKAVQGARTSMEDRAKSEARSVQAMAARAAEIAEVEHDDETVDFGPRHDHKPVKKRPETAKAAAKKAQAKKRRDTTTAAVSEVVLAKTGTDDLGF
ncbi:DDE-type integrase/transposase/recombinase [Pedococcus bigeumensis]|uniref:Transposase n=1 Tax=Pedococcus bigeumensis TaxID=433644 RepID=A0A502CW66_9MICO|nr:DDE-type integrase/transposase/recombinase [Pedococcus bigeumensis]TPG17053.1 transposase [Pedococcus bigeumensis]